MMAAALFGAIWSAYRVIGDQLGWSNAIACALTFFVSWFIYNVVIEPILSPLRKIPGMPFNPIIGNLPFMMNNEASEAHIKMMKMHGPIYRFYLPLGKVRLGVADVDILRHITITNCRNYIKPTNSLLGVLKMIFGEGLLTSEGKVHAVHKKLMNPAFNNQSVAKLIPTFEKIIHNLVERWKAEAVNGDTVEVAVARDLSRATLDIVGETAFGYQFNSLENPDHEIPNAFYQALSGIHLSFRMFVPFYSHLPFPDMLKLKKCAKIMNSVVQEIIQQKRDFLSKGSDETLVTKDVLGMMMLARDDTTGKGLSDKELRDQVMTLMLAGHETTAVAMSWCLLMLASNETMQEKAYREIVSVLGDDEPLTFENLEKLQYCGWIVKESLRLYPPAASTIRESLAADVLPGDIKIGPGTVLILSIGAIMRRPDLYDDPDSFRPERFEQRETESTFHHFIPFLIGPRMCIGYKFALVELKAMLAIILRHLRFDVIPGIKYKRKMALTMKPDPPLKLRVSVREV